jgi:hypothetical protein
MLLLQLDQRDILLDLTCSPGPGDILLTVGVAFFNVLLYPNLDIGVVETRVDLVPQPYTPLRRVRPSHCRSRSYGASSNTSAIE